MVAASTNDDQAKRTELLWSLLGTILETNGGFRIGPPSVVLADRSCMTADDVIERLKDTTWHIVFNNGRAEWVCFTTMVMLYYNLLKLREQIERSEASAAGAEGSLVGLDVTTDESVVMRPEIVQGLLRRWAV